MTHCCLLRPFTIVMFLLTTVAISAQVTGKWKTIGEEDGKEKAIVEIYEKDGKLFGKVLKLMPDAQLTHCARCQGSMKNQPIEGMVIIQDLKKTKDGGSDGKITDPSNGKTYNCFVELADQDRLKVRGYIGMPAMGRTQYWYRVRS